MRFLHILLAVIVLGAGTVTSLAVVRPGVDEPSAVAPTCAAREHGSAIRFQVSDESDARELARWCRAVGTPVFVSAPAPSAVPALDELVVMSWNAHLADGELGNLIARLRAGELTGGKPVAHFVLLVQELYRRNDVVPVFDDRDRSAFAITAPAEVVDVDDYAATLGLNMMYVPSMRNGAELREDRGNAIISTEPLLDPFALELPLARQRRVALGAAVQVRTAEGTRRLEVIDAHLEPLSSPKTLWIFKNPRVRQVRAILDVLDAPRYKDPAATAGIVLGGDFNTVRGGAREDAYLLARAWSNSLRDEDRRDTHMMGRLDYLFFQLRDGWTASTRRLDERFGSDHYPVVGMFSRP